MSNKKDTICGGLKGIPALPKNNKLTTKKTTTTQSKNTSKGKK